MILSARVATGLNVAVLLAGVGLSSPAVASDPILQTHAATASGLADYAYMLRFCYRGAAECDFGRLGAEDRHSLIYRSPNATTSDPEAVVARRMSKIGVDYRLFAPGPPPSDPVQVSGAIDPAVSDRVEADVTRCLERSRARLADYRPAFRMEIQPNGQAGEVTLLGTPATTAARLAAIAFYSDFERCTLGVVAKVKTKGSYVVSAKAPLGGSPDPALVTVAGATKVPTKVFTDGSRQMRALTFGAQR